MTAFILSEDKVTKRLILDDVNHGIQIHVIETEAVKVKVCGKEKIALSAWQVARSKVNDIKYEHHFGHGWYVPETWKGLQEKRKAA